MSNKVVLSLVDLACVISLPAPPINQVNAFTGLVLLLALLAALNWLGKGTSGCYRSYDYRLGVLEIRFLDEIVLIGPNQLAHELGEPLLLIPSVFFVK